MSRSKASMLAVLTAVFASAVMFSLPYSPAVVVQTTAAAKRDWTRTVLVSGTVGYRKQPCLALQSGIVAAVHVQPGQRVRKGDLLFQMDTSVQEKALASVKRSRYRQQEALMETDEMIAVMAVQREMEWQKTEVELLALIEASQVRAQNSGVIENIYVEHGDCVLETALLGMMRAEEKCIIAHARADVLSGVCADMKAVMMRNGEFIGNAFVQSVLAPDGTGMQQLMIQPETAADLKDYRDEEKITVEIERETLAGCVMIPISAVDAEGNAWFVSAGRASCEEADVLMFDDREAVVADKWEGRRVILNPDGLTEGCRVKEAKLQ